MRCDRGACDLDLPLDMESPLVFETPNGRFGVELARILAAQIRSAVQENWRELRAIEAKVEAISAEFDGEDVLHPTVRGRLEAAKESLSRLRDEVVKYTGPFDLPEPDDELSGLVEKAAEREMRNAPMR